MVKINTLALILYFFLFLVRNLKSSSRRAERSPALDTGLSPCSLWLSQLVWLFSYWSWIPSMVSVCFLHFWILLPPPSVQQTFFSVGENILSPVSALYFSAAAAAKSLQSCPTLCDPVDGSPSGSPSLGFSRQEHWSGLPFPSPMHESEKWKWSCSVVSGS